jgi:hypothetical protein
MHVACPERVWPVNLTYRLAMTLAHVGLLGDVAKW